MSEKLKPQHLQRKAILYVRQSSAYQVQHNQESQQLQYAMAQRLRQLGWQTIEVIDEDLGRSAAGTVARAGFERMVADVCLGQVGAVAAREVSRFARNSREWQQLVEVCRVVDTVLIDQEAVYSPRHSNDRLLLGLKGSLNEYELELLRERSLEARYEKARRGELIVAAPIGFLKTADQRLEKDPDQRVQKLIELVFDKVVELGSVRQTLLWLIEQGLALPVRYANGEQCWKRPTYATVYRLLTNPAYGGAYAYGKTEHSTCYEQGQPRTVCRRKPRQEWLVLIPEHHEGYLSWARFEQIQQMIADNFRGPGGRGAAKRGPGLLAGLLRCQRCGRMLTVHYTGREHDILRYSCQRGQLDNAEPRCIGFGGMAVDAAISQALLEVVQPAAVEAAVLANAQVASQHDEVLAALGRDWQAAQYAARRAGKQYDATDPENRLVSAELERRWNQALTRVAELEQRLDQHRAQCQPLAPPTGAQFETLGIDLAALWNDPATDARLKKRITRTLIHEVVADIDNEAGEIVLIVHWQGGQHTQLRLARRRRGQCTHTAKEIIEAVRVLVLLCADDQIAGLLNRNGLRTGRGNRWTRERVTSLRSKQGIARYRPEQRDDEGWMNLTEAARFLGLSPGTLRAAVVRGELPAQHPLGDGPWVFNRRDLQTEVANRLVERVRYRGKDPAKQTGKQASLDFSST